MKIKKGNIIAACLDVLLVSFCFLLLVGIKPATKTLYLPTYFPAFLILLFFWVVISIFFKKYRLKRYRSRRHLLIGVIACNFSILGISSAIMFLSSVLFFSRLVVFGLFGLSTVIEFSIGLLLYYTAKAGLSTSEASESHSEIRVSEFRRGYFPEKEEIDNQNKAYIRSSLVKSIIEIAGLEAYKFISTLVNISDYATKVVSTSTSFNIENLPDDRYTAIINLKRINGIRRINKFFEAANLKLPIDGVFIVNVETYMIRKERILKKFTPVISYPFYFFDFIFTRVFPKVWGIKHFYFFITAGRNRVLSKAEVLGRLVCCGFAIDQIANIGSLLYIISHKTKLPTYDLNPTYGPIVRMNRLGKDRKMIKVYKFRTMHPYSEYIQGYVFEQNDLQAGGKFKDDFRITTLGKILRKLWIDELPMLINWMKGEMKLVGARPLSKHYFSLYSKELQDIRTQYKPGLVPPFYVHKPETLDEIMQSELMYFNEYKDHPVRTDIKYLFKAIYNIIFKRYRSK